MSFSSSQPEFDSPQGHARVPKGSLKLAAVLDLYPGAPVAGGRCADLGCNVGGFTRELLRRGAASVVAVDCGHGTLEWGLRRDPRVEVRERSNALHQDDLAGLDVVVSDLAWTVQARIVPRAISYLRDGGWLFSLLKPQYENSSGRRRKGAPVLDEQEAARVAAEVFAGLPRPPSLAAALLPSPIHGAKGNPEFWVVYSPAVDLGGRPLQPTPSP